MIYVSDHGESLGENGLYLHGLPIFDRAGYADPCADGRVVVAVSFAADSAVDTRCVRGKSGDALSHDNLFHSVLGLLDVQTSVYKTERDIFEGCRGGRGSRVRAEPP